MPKKLSVLANLCVILGSEKALFYYPNRAAHLQLADNEHTSMNTKQSVQISVCV